MAANFWASSHCNRWLFSRSQLDKRKEHGRGSFSPEEVQVLNCHLLGLVEKIGEGLKWRQTVIATAKVLYKRFYIQKTLEKFDPRLIMVTSMYLAAKIEEMGQYSLTKLLNQVKAETRPFTLFPRYTAQHVHDFEFHVLQAVSFDLVVFHPYQYLITYTADADVDKETLQTAWDVLNDSYQTDVILVYPPHLIALAALYFAAVYLQRDVKTWYNRLNIPIPEIKNILNELTRMYKQRVDRQEHFEEARKLVAKKVYEKFKPMLEEQQRQHAKRKRENDERKRKKQKK